jgi:hypothetical protein
MPAGRTPVAPSRRIPNAPPPDTVVSGGGMTKERARCYHRPVRTCPKASWRAVTFRAESIFLVLDSSGRTMPLASLPQPPARLSDGQREAILAPDGPLLITAGPGTGKTLTVAERIAHLVTTGRASLTEILALTFSRAAARTLTARLAARLGAGAGGGRARRRLRQDADPHRHPDGRLCQHAVPRALGYRQLDSRLSRGRFGGSTSRSPALPGRESRRGP